MVCIMRRVLSVLTLMALASVPLEAQLTGQISGTVVDATGAAVPAARVGLYLPGGKSPLLTTVTNTAGLFDFTAVRPDLYLLVVETPGFTRTTLAEVKVDPARRLSLPPLTLSVASASQSVGV